MYGVAIAASLGTIAGLYGQFREGTGAITRVFEIIDTRPTIVDAPGAQPLARVDGRIELEAVSFGYGPERQVLRDVSLVIPAGGPSPWSGRRLGKTTLTALILGCGTYVAIRVDGGCPQRDRGQPARPIGLVAQEATLFGGTIRENILYGRLDATEAEVAAARAANADDFISALPDGYDTVVGDRGSRLSGGQRQRWHRPGDPRASADPAPRRGHQLADNERSGSSRTRSTGSRSAARRSSSPTACRPSGPPTAAVLDDGWLVGSTQDELLARTGCTPGCTDAVRRRGGRRARGSRRDPTAAGPG